MHIGEELKDNPFCTIHHHLFSTFYPILQRCKGRTLTILQTCSHPQYLLVFCTERTSSSGCSFSVPHNHSSLTLTHWFVLDLLGVVCMCVCACVRVFAHVCVCMCVWFHMLPHAIGTISLTLFSHSIDCHPLWQ